MANVGAAAVVLLLLLAAIPSEGGKPVLDVDGNQVGLDDGAIYRMRRATENRIVGGLSLRSVNGSCSKYVADGFELDPGFPVQFYPAEYSTSLELGMRMNIQFPTAPDCDGLSNYWFAADGSYVTLGGEKGGEFTNSWFYVAEGSSPGSYGLYLCPCLECRIACSPVGLSSEGELLLDGDAIEITFIRSSD